MDRPYLFCHMLTSLDGKIMGNYLDLPACEPAADLFYDIAFGPAPFYRHQGWLSGRVTTDDNFTHYRTPDLDPAAPPVPPGWWRISAAARRTAPLCALWRSAAPIPWPSPAPVSKVSCRKM